MKTGLEKFAETVAYKSFEVNPNDLRENDKGIDIAAILALIETIATIIKTVTDMCPNKSNLAKIAKNPSFTQRILFRAEARKACNDSENWQVKRMGVKAAVNALNEASKMTEEDLQKIVDEIALIDNGII